MPLKFARTAIGIGLLLSTLSCAKKGEADDLAKAQSCLDQVDQAQPATAAACLDYLKDYSDQQSDILRCSILMTSGGLVESKIVQAYNALKDDSQTNKAASFMAVLSLNVPDINGGYATAQKADVYCQSSGVPGLKYISSIIVAGTAMAQLIGTPIDTSNPAAINTAISNLVAHCGGTGTMPADCTANLPAMGAAVNNLASSYCTSSSADTSVCSQITGAQASAGGSNAAADQRCFVT